MKSRHNIPFAISLLALLLAAVTLASCHDDYDDLTTTAVFTLEPPEGYTIGRVQGQLTATYLSTRQNYISSDFDGAQLSIELMRGAYSISVEGTAELTDSRGVKTIRSFRASSSYAEMLSHPSMISLEMLLM